MNTAQIRKDNLNHILQMMSDGEEYTVKLIAQKTGLSTATCCTAVKILSRRNQIVGEKRQMNEVGRASVVYRINTEYDSVLNVQCVDGESKQLHGTVSYLYGRLRTYRAVPCGNFDAQSVGEMISDLLAECSGVVLIQVGLPHAQRERTDELKEALARRFHVQLNVACDCDFIACGLERQERERLIVVADYTRPQAPDFFGVQSGRVIANRRMRTFDLASFCGADPTECEQLIRAACLCAFLLSPDEIVFIGDCARGKLEEIKRGCERYLSDVPDIVYLETLATTYAIGMSNAARKMIM